MEVGVPSPVLVVQNIRTKRVKLGIPGGIPGVSRSYPGPLMHFFAQQNRNWAPLLALSYLSGLGWAVAPRWGDFGEMESRRMGESSAMKVSRTRGFG